MVCWQQAKMLYKYRGSLHTRMRTHTPPDEQNQSSGTAELRVEGAEWSSLVSVSAASRFLVERGVKLFNTQVWREATAMVLATGGAFPPTPSRLSTVLQPRL